MCDAFDNLDPNGNDWEILRFPAWGTCYIEMVFVRPGSAVALTSDLMRTSLLTENALDEDLLVEYMEEDAKQAAADKAERDAKVEAKVEAILDDKTDKTESQEFWRNYQEG
jgi:hypothetical protein